MIRWLMLFLIALSVSAQAQGQLEGKSGAQAATARFLTCARQLLDRLPVLDRPGDGSDSERQARWRGIIMDSCRHHATTTPEDLRAQRNGDMSWALGYWEGVWASLDVMIAQAIVAPGAR